MLTACSASNVHTKNLINKELTNHITRSNSLIPQKYNCTDLTVHCVDDGGEFDEFSSIQEAVDESKPGDVVLVFKGEYEGFRVEKSGSIDKPIRITANGNEVYITSGNYLSGKNNIYLLDVNYVIIEGFTVTGANKYGIGSHKASARYPMQGITIQFNKVSDSLSANIYLSHTANSFIIGNEVFNSLKSHGIYLSNAGSDNCVLSNNISYNNAKNGIHFNGDYRQGGDGIHTGLLITNNYFFNNVANGVDADGVHFSTFTNNVIYKNGRHGIRVFKEDAASGASNLVFANNTITGNRSEAIKLTNDLGGHTFFNNIFVDNQGAACVYLEDPVFSSGYNIYSSGCQFKTESNNLSKSQFINKTTRIASSSDLFIDILKDNFNIQVNSPAFNSGVKVFNGNKAPVENVLLELRKNSINRGAY